LLAMVELTYRCNFKCIHCYNTLRQKMSSSKFELSTSQIFHLIDQLVELGNFKVAFTGGEALLRRDIFDILWYARKNGLIIFRCFY